MSLDSIGQTQRDLLRALLRNKEGLTIDALAAELEVSRNAVRQHLATVERAGWVSRAARQASGGRPKQLYVLSPSGLELFPRQYSWFSELLIESISRAGDMPLEERLAKMGAEVGASLGGTNDKASTAERVNGVAETMIELGYEASANVTPKQAIIEAQNCVFHQLAIKDPRICRFDIAMMEASTGMSVEHRTCMARGAAKCCFAFSPRKK